MKTEIKTAIHVVEGCAGYNLVGYVPQIPIPAIAKYTHALAGVAVIAGSLLLKGEVRNHVISVGVGATLGGILDAFGLKR